MKKSFSFLALFFVVLSSLSGTVAGADGGSTVPKTQTGSTGSGVIQSGSTQSDSSVSEMPKPDPDVQEEISCLNILKQEVEADARYKYPDGTSENLSNVLVGHDSQNNPIRVNIADYKNGFTKHLQVNPSDRATHNFYARRNNVGTIIAEDNYVVTQFVTFGSESSFKFPLPTERGATPYGDDYGDFRDRLIYTHHLTDGTFLSCAYLRIVPAENRTLSDVHPDNYFTNGLDASGFELVNNQNNPKTDTFGNRYIVGKVNVPVLDLDRKPLMTIRITTVAWDNQSALFNEFETFPLQVRAMTDTDKRNDVNEVQQQFLQNVTNETCLQIPHASTRTLPRSCGGKYKSLTKSNKTALVPGKSLLSRFADLFVPNTYARLDIDPNELKSRGIDPEKVPQGMYIDESFRFDDIEKLDAIGDPLLKAHVMRVISPDAEKVIQMKQNSGYTLDNVDTVFLGCNMDYTTRVKLMSEWLDTVDPATFSVNNITYPDPKMGDCLIPYPDVRHKNEIISGSFLVNQYNAAVLSDNTGEIDRLAQELKVGDYAPKFDANNSKVATFLSNPQMRVILGGVLLFGGIFLIIVLLRRRK